MAPPRRRRHDPDPDVRGKLRVFPEPIDHLLLGDPSVAKCGMPDLIRGLAYLLLARVALWLGRVETAERYSRRYPHDTDPCTVAGPATVSWRLLITAGSSGPDFHAAAERCTGSRVTVHSHPMIDVEKVRAFLSRNGGQRFCDDCLARALGFRGSTRALRASATLAKEGDFRREAAACSRCSRTGGTIMALWVGV